MEPGNHNFNNGLFNPSSLSAEKKYSPDNHPTLKTQIGALYVELHRKSTELEKSITSHQIESQKLQAKVEECKKTIESLEQANEQLREENLNIFNKLEGREAYIRGLPTHQKVAELQDTVVSLRTSNDSLRRRVEKITVQNAVLQKNLQAKEVEVSALKVQCLEKDSEICELHQIVKTWNERREIAARSGKATLDDIIGEKMEIERELENLKENSRRNEEFLRSEIRRLELLNLDYVTKLNDTSLAKSDLEESLKNLQKQLVIKEEELENEKKINFKKDEIVKHLCEDIDSFKSTRNQWSKNLQLISRIVCRFTAFSTSLQNLMKSINNICQGKDPCPSALLSKPEISDLHIDWDADEIIHDTLDKIFALSEQLEKEVRDCQHEVARLYAEGLSLKFEPGCITQ